MRTDFPLISDRLFKVARILAQLYLLVLLSAISSAAQEIPKGVNYKKASDAVNLAAKSALEKALHSDGIPNELFDGPFVCGPMLWKALKPSASNVLLDAQPPVNVTIQFPQPVVAEAKGFRKLDEQRAFWNELTGKYPGLKTAVVRKAHPDEISYYWVTISFDIEEPFFVIETSSERFVVQFLPKNGKNALFWVDLVGDLRTLKNK